MYYSSSAELAESSAPSAEPDVDGRRCMFCDTMANLSAVLCFNDARGFVQMRLYRLKSRSACTEPTTRAHACASNA